MIYQKFNTTKDEIDKTLSSKAVKTVLAAYPQQKKSDVTILYTDDEEQQRLNLQFRGIDKTTDVLSFPADVFNPETGRNYLGDISISIPTARMQAEKAGHVLMDEIQILIVHGVLHLLGFDHTTPEEKENMWRAQAGFLDQLGLASRQLPE